MDEWVEVLPDIWSPEIDDFLQGVLVSKESDVGLHKSRLYIIEKENHKRVSVWGSAILDQRMDAIQLGEKVRIEFKGTEKNKKGQDIKIYKVMTTKKGEQDK